MGSVLYKFGEVLKDGLRKGETVNGIHIEVIPESSVVAIYEGQVMFTGYRRGYGNAVIIDHGGNYFTLSAHLDAIFVREGDQVEQNQQLGTSGDIATLYEPGLYFEIRQGSTPLDPLKWIQTE
ncbi:MAG: M23 family metallopeptidase [Candidatus Electrothrix sp. AR3]|nr:M23 family metallopeptidase [Candidatus Electrothrix sp. AR3]